MKKLLVPFVVLALVVAVAAGCGGGKSKNKAYAGSVSAFAAALNSICRPALAKARALHLKTMSDIAAKGDKFRSIQSTAIDKIASLQPPDQIKSTMDDVVAKGHEQISKVEDLVAAAKAGDTAKVQQIASEIQPLQAASNKDFAKIGANTCAEPG
jgi:hypothetical protein